MDKFSFFTLNIFINSFLAFFTALFLIEGIIFLFRIKQGRLAAILRMIPIVKLPLDLFLYDFSRWSFYHGVNPLSCEEGTRRLSVMFGWINSTTEGLFLPITSGIQMTTSENMTFTIADIIGQWINSSFLNSLTLLFLLISLIFLIKTVTKYCHYSVAFHLLAKDQQCKNKKIRNSYLKASLKKSRFKIITSSFFAGSPFVAGFIFPIVYIPTTLFKNLSSKEYEAVLAHEMQHIRHKDNLVRLILDFIGSVFWWVPTKWLQKRIEEGQEIASDLKCKSYGVNPIDLASAICKSAKDSMNSLYPVFARHLAKQQIHQRIDLLLQEKPARFRKMHLLFSCLATGIAFLVIFLGRFWTF
ncbi:MAG: M56 family metallopeptidase [Chlamydiae bacterium]|nr:M56 family metallopeptidase [Chlamydiota bacterium]